MMCYRTVIFVLLTKHCNAACFIDAYAGADQLVAEMNTVYGRAWNPMLQAVTDLDMDIKYPPKSSSNGPRPAIVLLHGGAFMSMFHKEDDGEPDFQNRMATHGFVAASINYRELRGFAVHGQKADSYVVLKAVEDARAAIRYLQFRSNQSDLYIDTAQIAIGGDSAGAITAMFLAYAPEAQYEGYSGYNTFASLPAGGFHLAAVVEVSGCLDCFGGSTNYLGKNSGATTPIVVVHGDADEVIDPINGINIKEAADSNPLMECLYAPVAGGNHVPLMPYNLMFVNTKSWLFDQGPDESRTYFQTFMAFMVRVMHLRDEQCPRLGRRASEDLFV